MTFFALILLALLQQVLPTMGSTQASGGVPATFVQAQTCNGTGTTTCSTTAMSVTAGNTIVFCFSENSAGATFTPSESTGTDTFTSIWSAGGSNGNAGQCWYVLSTTASGSTQFTGTSVNSGTLQGKVVELSHVTGQDVAGTGQTAATNTTITCPNITTSHSNALVFCFAGLNSSTSSWTPSAGETIPTGGSNTTAASGAVEYITQVSPGTVSASFTSGTSRTSVEGTFSFY
jgi:hypothetical protein